MLPIDIYLKGFVVLSWRGRHIPIYLFVLTDIHPFVLLFGMLNLKAFVFLCGLGFD